MGMDEQKPPPVIYKYFPVGDYLPKIFSGQSLKFSNPLEFNDPFECQPCYFIENGSQGKQFLKELSDLVDAKSPAEKLLARQRAERMAGKLLPRNSFPGMERLFASIGVSCFSETKDNLLMWSHYADEHKGVCIGFDTKIHFFEGAWKVAYQDEYPVITRPSDNPNTLLKKAILTKSSCWAYEQEWRVTRRTMSSEEQVRAQVQYGHIKNIQLFTEQHGPGLYPFPQEAIVEVLLGARMSPPVRQEVCAWIEESGLKAPVFEARRHTSRFGLEFHPV